jgi:oligoendopeptidase F
MQFWAKAESNYETTLAEYIALCQLGGKAPFQELVRSANLVSPFQPGCLKTVVDHARKFLQF